MKKKTIIRILEWNLNFASDDNAVPANFTVRYIKGNDIIVLTEVRANKKLISIIKALGYDCIIFDDQGKYTNQIIIMAKKEYKITKISGALNQSNGSAGPDFLHGTIMVGEKVINIIGIRVKQQNFSDRYIQFQLMRKNIANINGSIICAGDFNSGQIRGMDEADYSDVRNLYRYTNGGKDLSELRFYNFHMIRDLLGKEFVLKEIMGEDNSWGLFEKDGKLFYGGEGARVKNDLLFYSADIEGDSRYSWQHVKQNEKVYLDMLEKNRSRERGNKIDHGYPDHARLIADLAV